MNCPRSAKSTISIETLGDLLAAHAQDGGVEKDIVASAQLLVEPGTEFEECRHPLGDLDVARVRRQDAGHALEQGRLARTVVANNAERLAGFDIERNVSERPKLLVAVAAAGGDERFERRGSFLMNSEGLGDVGHPQRVVGASHRSTDRAVPSEFLRKSRRQFVEDPGADGRMSRWKRPRYGPTVRCSGIWPSYRMRWEARTKLPAGPPVADKPNGLAGDLRRNENDRARIEHELSHDAPQIVDVVEEDVGRRQGQGDASGEQRDEYQQQCHREQPLEHEVPEEEERDREHDELDADGDELGDHDGEHQVLVRERHLLDQARPALDVADRSGDRDGEELERQEAREEVEREVVEATRCAASARLPSKTFKKMMLKMIIWLNGLRRLQAQPRIDLR